MKQDIPSHLTVREKLNNELVKTIRSDIKFFTLEADGSFALKQKSIDEIKSILARGGAIA